MVKQTAGRDTLNDFAPKFAELNDNVLFEQVWSREDKLPIKIRSIVTLTALVNKGIVGSSLSYHLSTAKKNSVTKTEMAEILTHIAFMQVGRTLGLLLKWPKKFTMMIATKKITVDFLALASLM